MLEVAVFVVAPLAGPAMLAAYLVGAYHPDPFTLQGKYIPDGGFLFDFHVMWQAGRDVATAHSPYPFVYPAPAAFLMVPFGLLPWKLAVVAMALFVIGALFVTLRLLGVRDWRCYGAALAAMPSTSAVTLGSLSTFLPLCAAVAWRYRDRRWPPAVAIMAAVVTKIFLWPLVVWLIATRRFRAAATSVALGVAVTFGSWAILGFDGMLDYPHGVGRVADLEQARSYSPFALVQSLGASTSLARLSLLGVAVAGIAAIFALARTRDGDRHSFIAAIAVGLALSPIVWLHYLVLVYVVIALYRTELSIAWLLPLLYWLLPGQDSHGSTSVILEGYAITIGAVLLAMRPWRPLWALRSRRESRGRAMTAGAGSA